MPKLRTAFGFRAAIGRCARRLRCRCTSVAAPPQSEHDSRQSVEDRHVVEARRHGVAVRDTPASRAATRHLVRRLELQEAHPLRATRSPTVFPISSLFDAPPSADRGRLESRAHSRRHAGEFRRRREGRAHRARPVDHALRAQARARRQDFADRVAGRRPRARAGGDERAHRGADSRKVRGRHRGAESNGLDRRDSRNPRRASQSRPSAAALDGARKRHHRPARSSAISARCRTCSSPARPARANRSA